ncbi:MAG: hypothetical protein FJ333_11325 [Sphingomonadales bacterium]|nr:hypothetical protein [Sphingomonadales bacterium]
MKRAKKEQSLIRSFAKSAEKRDRSFALLQRATKRAIAHLLFLKEGMSELSLNRSFEKSGNERLPNPQDWAFVHFENEGSLFFFSKKFAIRKIAHFFAHFALSLFLKEQSGRAIALFVALFERAIAHFIALFERAKEQSLFWSLF